MMLRRVCAIAVLCVASSPVTGLHAQQSAPGTFDFERAREPVVELGGLWRFHPGDESSWAEPGLDDSGWAAIRGDRSWIEQGYKDLSGYAWYRARVVLPPETKPLALYIPRTLTNFQVFVDGRRLEGCDGGSMDKWSAVRPVVCDLPQAGSSKTVTLAIRVWDWPYMASATAGGMQSPVLIGERAAVSARSLADVNANSWTQAGPIVIATLILLSSVAGFLLFLFRRDQREYLWFGIFVALQAILWMLSIHYSFYSFAGVQNDVWQGIVVPAGWVAEMLFLVYLLRARRDWLFWLAVGVQVLALLLVPLEISEGLSLSTFLVCNNLACVPSLVWIFVLLIRRAAEGDTDGRLVLVPLLLGFAQLFVGGAVWALKSIGLYRGDSTWVYGTVARWPFPFHFYDLTEALFLIAMLVILIYRFNRSSAHEERMAGELSAAHAVQHILIPQQVPELPGFAIESVYRPANEVGGDFFQILPTASGGVLAVIGDVSGKGVPAAMIVSLLVGTLRTLAKDTDRPAELLDGMNRQLIGRSSGFTTCLILRADPDGRCVVANAGHLPFYVDGREVEVDAGLPLGISAEASYEEVVLPLEDGARITLWTDGVVEARSRTGELYGFERAAAVARKPAAEIAAEAQAFGQEDDITVVSVTRAVMQPMGAVRNAARAAGAGAEG